jgi:hypothetical protein
MATIALDQLRRSELRSVGTPKSLAMICTGRGRAKAFRKSKGWAGKASINLWQVFVI